MRAITTCAGAVLAVLFLAGTGHRTGDGRVFAQTGARRAAAVIADLHMGVGKDATTGQWHAVEDFRWQSDFAAFLLAVNQAGAEAADLVLNGDTFELWQSVSRDCQYQNARLGCTEPEALARLERILAAHSAEIADLGRFARAGTNRVVFVPGDHDAALVFPSLAKRLVEAVGAPGRVEVAARGYWLSSDGAVYAEHGHQFADDPYRFAQWPEPFIRDGGRVYLERSRGEQAVQGFFNEHELRYPTLDNFAEQGAGLSYAVAADPAVFPADRVAPVLRHLISRQSWQQFRKNMNEGVVEPPLWDLPAIRADGPRFLVDSVMPDDPFRAVADRALKEGRLVAGLSDLSDQEIIAICDYRAAMRRARRRNERSLSQVPLAGPNITECARIPSTRGDEFEYFWGGRDRRFSERIEQAAAMLKRDGRSTTAPGFFVFGHTHLVEYGFVPALAGDSPVVMISAPWQRTVTPFQAEQIAKERGWSTADLLKQLQPEQLPGCYGVVWVDAVKPLAGPRWVADGVQNDVNPRVRSWRADGRWGGRLNRGDAVGAANACAAEAGSQ